MKNAADNGGFPRAPEGVETAVVEVRHSACAGATRIVVPRVLPAAALRRVICANCGREFEPAPGAVVPLVGVSAVRPSPEELPPEFFAQAPPPAGERRRSRLALLLLIPLLAAATIGGLALIRAIEPSGDKPAGTTPDTREATVPTGNPTAEAQQIVGQGYTFILPAGWISEDPPEGARYHAVSADGLAEVTLWADTESDLDFPEFVEVSLAELRETAGSAEVISRTPAATPEESVVQIGTPESDTEPRQLVTLRFNGPYRFYFKTVVQPDAPPELVTAVESMHQSFEPISISGGGGGKTGGGKDGKGSDGGSDGKKKDRND